MLSRILHFDPRPNAFMDNEHGICRVYHGPTWGNPFGSLYPRRTGPDPPPILPVGTPHPLNNPYYYGMLPTQAQQQMMQQMYNMPQPFVGPIHMGMKSAGTPHMPRSKPHTPSLPNKASPQHSSSPGVGMSGWPAQDVLNPENIATKFSDNGSRKTRDQDQG